MDHLLIFDLSNVYYIGAKSRHNTAETVEGYFEAASEYLRSQYRYFRPDKLVFACDHEEEYWRKKVFPEYKANRLDSEFKRRIREAISRFKIQNKHLCLEHPGCEADDIIYALCAFTEFRITIVSSDGDFEQLLSDRVRVFNPMRCQFTQKPKEVGFDLFVKCIRGDRGDNIPSILPMVTRKRLQEAYRSPEPIAVLARHYRFHEDLEKDYARNRELIDLSCLPTGLKQVLTDKVKQFF